MPDAPAVVVVGAGPAGLMASDVLAKAGVAVTVVDQMPSAGRKFLLAGRGGLNLTHSEAIGDFLGRYGPARPFLEDAINNFGPIELRAWCDDLGEETFVGSSGRVFPASFRATPLLRAWLRRLNDRGVTFEFGTRWLGWSAGGVEVAGHAGVRTLDAEAVVLALGGASWPRTGSTGEWTTSAREAGVGVSPLRPANCGLVVMWSDRLRDAYSGVAVKDVEIATGDARSRGDLVVTGRGLEGGPAYAIASAVRDATEDGSVVVHIDLLPERSEPAIVERLRRGRVKDSTASALRRLGLASVAVALARKRQAIRFRLTIRSWPVCSSGFRSR